MKLSRLRNPNDPAPAADPSAMNYLVWLAARRMVAVPDNASYRLDGIWTGATLLLAMPGYGASDVVTMETLDESGAVVRSQRLACAANGSIALKAPDVREAVGPIAKPAHGKRKAPAVEIVEPVAPAEMVEAPAPITQNPPADSPHNASSIAEPTADTLASLVARIAALEEMVATLSHGNAQPAAVEKVDDRAKRLRLARRYLAMRAARRRDRVHHEIGQAQYDDLKAHLAKADQRAEVAEFKLSAMSDQLAVAIAARDEMEAATLPALDDAQGRLVRLEREVATWQRRAEGAGYKAPAFQLGALMSGKRPIAA